MAPSPRKKTKNSKPERTTKVKNDQVSATNPDSQQSSLDPEIVVTIRSVSVIIITLFSMNVARICCLLALHPLFGSIASSYNFEIGVQVVDFVIAPIVNLLCPNLIPSPTAGNFLAAFLVWRAPDSFGRILSVYSSRFDILIGPLVFQSMAYWPIRLAGMSAIYQLAMKSTSHFEPLHTNKILRKISYVSLPLVLHGASRLMLPLAQTCLKSFPPGQIFNLSPPILLATTVIGSVIGISKYRINKTIIIKKVNMVIFLGCIMSAVYMPLPQNLSHEPELASKSTGYTADYRTLARRLSSTGMVLVGELTQETGSRFRFMRCDHSLLGGVWNGLAKKSILERQIHAPHPITTEELEAQSVAEAESIYPTFILQTAVRLVERSQDNLTANKEKTEALILGLGVGISARLLMNHGDLVTVVEIDPLIYEYSTKYFGLPRPNGGLFLEDARVYLNREGQSDRFDYVIHDMFTGGAVPSSLFTLECWREIRARLKEDGVLAVNFVGRPMSDAGSMVLTTLLQVFPFCRAFLEDSDGPISETDFQNLVIFCSPLEKPKFRKLTSADATGLSVYQHRILDSFQDHEADLAKILQSADSKVGNNTDRNRMVLNDKNRSKLDRAQAEAGLHHWKVMREALPDHLWNSYYD